MAGGRGAVALAAVLVAALACWRSCSRWSPRPRPHTPRSLRSDPPHGGMVPVGPDHAHAVVRRAGQRRREQLPRCAPSTASRSPRTESPRCRRGPGGRASTTAPLERGHLRPRLARPVAGGRARVLGHRRLRRRRPTATRSPQRAEPAARRTLLLLRWLDLSALLLALGVPHRRRPGAGRGGGTRAARACRPGCAGWPATPACAAVYAGVVTPFLRTRQSGHPARRLGRADLGDPEPTPSGAGSGCCASWRSSWRPSRWSAGADRGSERPRARTLALAALAVGGRAGVAGRACLDAAAGHGARPR